MRLIFALAVVASVALAAVLASANTLTIEAVPTERTLAAQDAVSPPPPTPPQPCEAAIAAALPPLSTCVATLVGGIPSSGPFMCAPLGRGLDTCAAPFLNAVKNVCQTLTAVGVIGVQAALGLVTAKVTSAGVCQDGPAGYASLEEQVAFLTGIVAGASVPGPCGTALASNTPHLALCSSEIVASLPPSPPYSCGSVAVNVTACSAPFFAGVSSSCSAALLSATRLAMQSAFTAVSLRFPTASVCTDGTVGFTALQNALTGTGGASATGGCTALVNANRPDLAQCIAQLPLPAPGTTPAPQSLDCVSMGAATSDCILAFVANVSGTCTSGSVADSSLLPVVLVVIAPVVNAVSSPTVCRTGTSGFALFQRVLANAEFLAVNSTPAASGTSVVGPTSQMSPSAAALACALVIAAPSFSLLTCMSVLKGQLPSMRNAAGLYPCDAIAAAVGNCVNPFLAAASAQCTGSPLLTTTLEGATSFINLALSARAQSCQEGPNGFDAVKKILEQEAVSTDAVAHTLVCGRAVATGLPALKNCVRGIDVCNFVNLSSALFYCANLGNAFAKCTIPFFVTTRVACGLTVAEHKNLAEAPLDAVIRQYIAPMRVIFMSAIAGPQVCEDGEQGFDAFATTVNLNAGATPLPPSNVPNEAAACASQSLVADALAFYSGCTALVNPLASTTQNGLVLCGSLAQQFQPCRVAFWSVLSPCPSVAYSAVAQNSLASAMVDVCAILTTCADGSDGFAALCGTQFTDPPPPLANGAMPAAVFTFWYSAPGSTPNNATGSSSAGGAPTTPPPRDPASIRSALWMALGLGAADLMPQDFASVSIDAAARSITVVFTGPNGGANAAAAAGLSPTALKAALGTESYSTVFPAPPPPPSEHHFWSEPGPIVGLVLAGIVVATLLVVGCVHLVRMKAQQTRDARAAKKMKGLEQSLLKNEESHKDVASKTA